MAHSKTRPARWEPTGQTSMSKGGNPQAVISIIEAEALQFDFLRLLGSLSTEFD